MTDSAIDFSSLIPQQQQQSSAPQSAIDFSGITPAFKSSILPMSRSQAGDNYLDWSAGIPGMAQQMFKGAVQSVLAPGQAMTGDLPTPYSPQNPTTDPTQAINRAATTAQLFSPASAALRAREVIPGELAMTSAPSAKQLVQAANKGYSTVRDSGLEINGDSIGNLVQGIKSNLLGTRGIVDELAPKTFTLLKQLDNPPPGSVVTFPYLDAIRRGLGGVRMGSDPTDALAAKDALGGFDNFMSTLNNSVASTADSRAAAAQANVGQLPAPLGNATSSGTGLSPAQVANVWSHARGNYAAAMRSNDLTGALDRANTGILDQAVARASATNSGRNIGNSIKQRVASYLQSPDNVAGLNDQEIGALNNVIQGGPVQNQARLWANRIGGGQGMHGGIASVVGATVGEGMHPGLGAAIGAASPMIAGTALKGLENRLATRSLNNADDLIRQRSPLYQAMTANGGGTTPGINKLPIPGLLPSPTPTGVMPGLLQQPGPQPITPDQLRLLQQGGA